MKRSILSAALLLFLAACDAIGGPGDGGRVSVRFATRSAGQLSSNLVSGGDARPLSDLVVTGTNGNLVIEDIRFIVQELELESSDEIRNCDDDDDDEFDDDDNVLVASRDDDEEDDDECEFEGGPFIVDLNLDGATTISTEDVPPGTYDRLEFEVEDLEVDDEDEDDEASNYSAVLAEMRAAYPNFPSRASLVVKGTQNGQPFIVYFRSDIEVSQVISPPLVVPSNDVITIDLNPALWFKNGSQVVNLLALNGRLVDIGDGFRGGILGAHRDDDD